MSEDCSVSSNLPSSEGGATAAPIPSGSGAGGASNPPSEISKPHSELPSAERIAEYAAGAEKVLADELPAGHKLWKSWALDLADNVLTLARKLDVTQEQYEGAMQVAKNYQANYERLHEQNGRQATNIGALYRQRREAELACELSREENRRLLEQLDAERQKAYAARSALGDLEEQLEALRNFNEATRAAYATLTSSGAGVGAVSPSGSPASDPAKELP